MIRPEAQAFLTKWQGVAGALAVALAGLWLATRGGWLLAAVGTALGAFGLALALDAWRRARFHTQDDGPGAVEVIEGQVAFFGPETGGFLALSDLQSVGLLRQNGQRVWMLRQSDGHSLAVPVDARGAEALYSALTALPGIDGGTLLAALDQPQDRPVVWQAGSAAILPFSPRV